MHVNALEGKKLQRYQGQRKRERAWFDKQLLYLPKGTSTRLKKEHAVAEGGFRRVAIIASKRNVRKITAKSVASPRREDVKTRWSSVKHLFGAV